jgi:hypothetical protein
LLNSVYDGCAVDALGELAGFRREMHRGLTARADALFELTETLLCTDGPVKSLVGLTLAPEQSSSTPTIRLKPITVSSSGG